MNILIVPFWFDMDVSPVNFRQFLQPPGDLIRNYVRITQGHVAVNIDMQVNHQAGANILSHCVMDPLNTRDR